MEVHRRPLRRQVPSIWLNLYPRPIVYASWGWQLGAGTLTQTGWAGFYVMLACALLLDPPATLGCVLLYGLTRGVQPLVALGSPALHEAIQNTKRLYVCQCATLCFVALILVR